MKLISNHRSYPQPHHWVTSHLIYRSLWPFSLTAERQVCDRAHKMQGKKCWKWMSSRVNKVKNWHHTKKDKIIEDARKREQCYDQQLFEFCSFDLLLSWHCNICSPKQMKQQCGTLWSHHQWYCLFQVTQLSYLSNISQARANEDQEITDKSRQSSFYFWSLLCDWMVKTG